MLAVVYVLCYENYAVIWAPGFTSPGMTKVSSTMLATLQDYFYEVQKQLWPDFLSVATNCIY